MTNANAKITLTGLYLRNIGANLLGFCTIVVLNVFTPLDFIRMQRAMMFGEGRWKTFFLFIPILIVLISLIQYIFQSPVKVILHDINKGQNISGLSLEKTKKRLLNLPYIMALTNIIAYFIIPVFVLASMILVNEIPVKNVLFLYFRAIMTGMISSVLCLLLLEDHIRKKLVPVFFPNGRLADISGTIRLSILRKIRALTGAGTLNPMIILIVTLIFIVFDIEGSTVSASELARSILFFTCLLFFIFIIIGFRLNTLVADSIVNPIKNMVDAVEKVEQGDLSTEIKVVSSDELGILGDAGNNMIHGLADRERIRETFGKYVTPEIRDRILAGEIPLNGEQRIATLLFSDLRGFTPYVEDNAPEEIIRSMREYFTAMQKAIAEYNGLVLQYVGDEIEAVFGVPVMDENHHEMALKAALKMRENLEELNRQRENHGKPGFRHGIGIYTGMVLAGNTGSEDRLSYTLIGNTVNLASRIQEMTKALKCDILVSETTVKMLKSTFNLKKEESRTVKGYSRPITVYSIPV